MLQGLPGEAAVWRDDMLPPLEERLAQILEKLDEWMRVHLDAKMATPGSRLSYPGPVRVPRPGDAQESEQPKVLDDPNQIAAWMAMMGV